MGANMKLSVRDREEAIRALLAGLMLLVLFGLVTYYALMNPGPRIEASKLVLLGPSEYSRDVVAELTIKAVDNEGIVDSSRSDLIRVSLDPSSHAQLGFSDQSGTTWSSSLTIRLEAGQRKVTFLDKQDEKVRVAVEWLEGKSPLKPDVIELYSGWRGF
jgi:hypothetical protein